MQLINVKIHLELGWIENCILFSDGNSEKFRITDAKLHVPIVTLSIKDNVNLTKQLSEGFKKSVNWNSNETKPAKVLKKEKTYMSYLVHHFKVIEDLVQLQMLQKMK